MWLSATQKQGPPSPNPLLLRHGLSLSLFICFRKKKDELIWKKWWEATSGQEDMEKNCDGGASRKPAKKRWKNWNFAFREIERNGICGYHNSLHYFDIISLIDLCGDPALSQHILNYIDSSGELYSTNYQGKREAYLHIYHVGRDWIFIQRCLVTNRHSYMKWYLPT